MLFLLLVCSNLSAQVSTEYKQNKAFYLEVKDQNPSSFYYDDLLRLKKYAKSNGKKHTQLALFTSVLTTVISLSMEDTRYIAPVAIAGGMGSIYLSFKGVNYHQKADKYNDVLIEKLVNDRMRLNR